MPLLWPGEAQPAFPRCPRCGAARRLELQLMAPMWHFMDESLAWYREADHDRPKRLDATVLEHPEWDWLTVAVATCAASCHAGPERHAVVEEVVVGFNLLHGAGGTPAAPERSAALARVLGARGEVQCSAELRGGSGIAQGTLPSVSEDSSS
jgi:Programmed cell death protein 2, C-terminal putative domain